MSDDSITEDAPRIDVKAAIRSAKAQVVDMLEGEAFSQLGLEEVKYDDRSNEWLITLGLNRPWDIEKQLQTGSNLYGSVPTTTTRQIRAFKKIRINGRTGAFISMED